LKENENLEQQREAIGRVLFGGLTIIFGKVASNALNILINLNMNKRVYAIVPDFALRLEQANFISGKAKFAVVRDRSNEDFNAG
jgi:hypothetical protein